MGQLLRGSIVLTFMAVSACGGSPSSSSSPPPSGASESVTGRERFGWTQSGAGASDLALYQYAVYVDGARRVLAGVTCAASAGDTSDCSAPLPTLSAGRHTLELATFIDTTSGVLESARAAPLQITVTAVTAGPLPAGAQSGVVVSSDGLELTAEILLRDLTDPVDVAVDATGRSFVAERSGRLRIVSPRPVGAPVIQDLGLSGGHDAIVLSLALASDNVRGQLVYLMFADPGPRRTVVRIVRFREAAGIVGQAAVVATFVSTDAEPAGVLRVGPDGALYAGLSARDDGEDAQRLSSESGKILRLRADGSTPSDNPRQSPVYSTGHRDPRGLAWHPAGGALWEVEGDELNTVRPGDNYGWPFSGGRDPVISGTRPAIALPRGTDPSGLAIVGNRTSPLFGDLVVSSFGAEDIFRIRMTGAEAANPSPARLVQGRFGRVAQVSAAPGGDLYFVTGNRESWGAGNDLLVRLIPLSR